MHGEETRMEPVVVGEVVEAVVTRLEPYGAWIECGGRPGLVTIPEVSWSRIRHPGDVLAVGQAVRVKVLLAPTDHPFSASVRATRPDLNPWVDPTVFAAGTEFTAPVVRVLEYGCFVELRPDVWGLLKRGDSGNQPAVGEVLRVRVTHSDPTTRKVEVVLKEPGSRSSPSHA